MSESVLRRQQVLDVARQWLDTPYQHQASAKGAGCDCLGLIRGIWRALYGSEPETPANYTPNWAEDRGAETLLNAARRWLIPTDAPRPGDVLLFRMQTGCPCKHIGVLAAEDRLIHAYWGRAVVESWLEPFWARRIAFTFSFPVSEPSRLNQEVSL
jgi:NlpC/P60 family putative phage cell wall peptidase